MSDRWGGYEDTAKLRERITVIETNLPLVRADSERQFRQLSEGRSNNRQYIDQKFTELKRDTDDKFGQMAVLIKTQSPSGKSVHSDRLFWAIMVVGAVVTLVGILVIANWLADAGGVSSSVGMANLWWMD